VRGYKLEVSAMQRWEYMKLRVKWTYTEDGWEFEYENKRYSVDDLISVMNMLGQQSWEHITVLPFNITISRPDAEDAWTEISTDKYDLFFKRPVE
jgi:hypothetical protein